MNDKESKEAWGPAGVMKPPKSSCAADSRALGVEFLLLAQAAVRELSPTVDELKVRDLEVSTQ